MKIDPLVFLQAFFSPLFLKMMLVFVLVAIFFRIINVLIERKLKKMKPMQLESSKLIVIAVVILVSIVLFLKLI